MSSSSESKIGENLFSGNNDQAAIIGKIDDHVKARFNLVFLRFDSLPKLNVGNQTSVDKWNEEFSFFKVAYPKVLDFLLDYDPNVGTKISELRGIMFTGGHLRIALDAIYERFRLTLLSKVPKVLQQSNNIIKAAYDTVFNHRDYSLNSKLLRKFKEIELELTRCYNLAYIQSVEQKIQEVSCDSRDTLSEYVRALPDFKGHVLQFNHSRRSEALSLYLNCHAKHYLNWMELDQDTSKLPTCEDIAREVSENPDYFRLVKIEATEQVLNLFVRIPDEKGDVKDRKSVV